MNYLSIILVSLLMSAFFSGMEVAFIASNKLRIELDKKHGLFASKIISFLVQRPSEYITTMLIGNYISLVVYGFFMARILEPGIAQTVISGIAIILTQVIISALIILVTAEFLSKSLVRINPNFMLNIFSLPAIFFYILFYPVTLVVVGFVNIFRSKRIKANSSDKNKNPVFNKVDLYHLIAETGEKNQEDNSDADELKLFQNALEFSGIKVRDCMIPRNEIVAMDINTDIESLKQKFIETGFSKILIYENSFDNFIGYFTSKALFKNPKDIKPLLIKISFVPETMAAKNLLHRLIKEQRSMALVVDEFGGISGLVTIEDIIEEIIGDIEDEHDSTALIEKQINDDEYIFSGRLEIEYINEKYNLGIAESEEYDTLAGYIFFHFESFPKLHERIVTGNIECKIIKVSKTKIELVQLKVSKNVRHKSKKPE
ncbi:MAG: hemolysin family protein [Bacteroidales bacterium]